MDIDKMSLCKICNMIKPLSEFYKLNAYRYHKKCRICYKILQQKKYRLVHKKNTTFTRLTQEQKKEIKKIIMNNDKKKIVNLISKYLNYKNSIVNYWYQKGFLDEL